jgi:hypothetical protein
VHAKCSRHPGYNPEKEGRSDGTFTIPVNAWEALPHFNAFGIGLQTTSGDARSNQCISVNGRIVCQSHVDGHNFLHGPNTIHYRDSNANCSTHVVVNSKNGQVVESHVDEYNPNFDLFNHATLDVIPDLIYDVTKFITGTGVYPIPAGRSFCQP